MIAICQSNENEEICRIINESAQAYKGTIPADRWHDPYMPLSSLESEMHKGVRFYGYYQDKALIGVMGIQDVKDVTLIRHAYILTEYRNKGVGGKLLEHMKTLTSRPILIGAWKAAVWAVAFYEKNGFRLTTTAEKNRLLKTYWTIPERQIEESVVLANKAWDKNLKSTAEC